MSFALYLLLICIVSTVIAAIGFRKNMIILKVTGVVFLLTGVTLAISPGLSIRSM